MLTSPSWPAWSLSVAKEKLKTPRVASVVARTCLGSWWSSFCVLSRICRKSTYFAGREASEGLPLVGHIIMVISSRKAGATTTCAKKPSNRFGSATGNRSQSSIEIFSARGKSPQDHRAADLLLLLRLQGLTLQQQEQSPTTRAASDYKNNLQHTRLRPPTIRAASD